MLPRKPNLLRLVHRHRWDGVLFAALFAVAPVRARPATSRADAGTPPRVGAPARRPTPLQRAFEQARAAQARYDMPGFFAWVRDCRELAFTEHKMLPAKLCDDAMFGAAQRLGDPRAMVEADYWWLQHGFSAADKTSKLHGAFEKADLAHLVGTVPALTATVVGDSSTLEYLHRIEFAGRVAAGPPAAHRPTVTATINGKPVAVLVDTGTVLPLMMDQSHAAALGATPLLGGWVAPGKGRHAVPGAKGFGTDVIARFRLGGLVMHNLAAAVVPDGTFHVGVMVGLPVLARFGRVNLGDTRITTGGVAPRCTNRLPLRFVGTGQLGFSTIANGRPATAMIDTGSMYALYARPGSGPHAPTMGNPRLQETRETPPPHRRHVGVRLGRWSMTGVDMPDAKISLPPGVDVSIGAPLLAFADVGIDFSKPSLCVGPRPSVKDGLVLRYGDGREASTANDPFATLLRMLDGFLTKVSPPGATHDARAARAH